MLSGFGHVSVGSGMNYAPTSPPNGFTLLGSSSCPCLTLPLEPLGSGAGSNLHKISLKSEFMVPSHGRKTSMFLPPASAYYIRRHDDRVVFSCCTIVLKSFCRASTMLSLVVILYVVIGVRMCCFGGFDTGIVGDLILLI